MPSRLLILACALSAVAPAARAQPTRGLELSAASPHAPATADAVPDTTDWRRYFPLAIGNRWEYYPSARPSVETAHGFGREIIGDTLIDGDVYFVVRDCFRYAGGEAVGCSDRSTIKPFSHVRYDSAHALVVERVVTEGVPHVVPWDIAPCQLDLPFGAAQAACSWGEDPAYHTWGGHGFTHAIGDDTLRNVTIKVYDSLPQRQGWVAGVGMGWHHDMHMPGQSVLTYARIGGKAYGTKRVFVSSESAAPPAAPGLAIEAAYPHPFRDRLTVRFRTQGLPLTHAAVYDVLGRRVATLRPQNAAMEVDATELAGGVYVLRLCDAHACVAYPVVKSQ